MHVRIAGVHAAGSAESQRSAASARVHASKALTLTDAHAGFVSLVHANGSFVCVLPSVHFFVQPSGPGAVCTHAQSVDWSAADNVDKVCAPPTPELDSVLGVQAGGRLRHALNESHARSVVNVVSMLHRSPLTFLAHAT